MVQCLEDARRFDLFSKWDHHILCLAGADISRNPRTDDETYADRDPRADSGTRAGRDPRADSGAYAGRDPRADSGAYAGRNPRADSGACAGRDPRADSGAHDDLYRSVLGKRLGSDRQSVLLGALAT